MSKTCFITGPRGCGKSYLKNHLLSNFDDITVTESQDLTNFKPTTDYLFIFPYSDKKINKFILNKFNIPEINDFNLLIINNHTQGQEGTPEVSGLRTRRAFSSFPYTLGGSFISV